MANTPDVRRYTDSEVRALLERAARMPGKPRSAPTPSRGLTLAQLEEIATEAQIDVATLRQAALELDAEKAAQPVGPAAQLAGAPLRVMAERTLPFEVDEDALGAIVASIHAASDDSGKARIVGRTFTWSASTNSGRRVEVNVSVRKGATHVRVEERYGELAGGLYGGVLGGVGGGVGLGVGGALAGALGSAAVAVAFPLVVISGSYAACRFGFGAYVKRRRRQVDALCERIVHDLTALQ